MITNREEVLENAFKVFIKMNYEKASFTEIAKACGLTRTGIIHYYPCKQDLFVAVIDKFIFHLHHPGNKFSTSESTLAEFIERYIEGVTISMKKLTTLISDGDNLHDCSPNFYYFHFFSQVRMYYPNVRQKIIQYYQNDYDLWIEVIQRAKANKEIRADIDIKKAATMFRQMYFGLSYEQSFLNGLDIEELANNFRYIYSLLKA